MKNYNPQNIKKITIRVALFVLLFVSYNISYSQSGVGIGTSTPNPNAILDIVSSNNDKGILIPRLTTTQRTAMNASLTSNENGLMVFDSDLDGFYFWSGTNWSSMVLTQDLELAGNILKITNNGAATPIDLSPLQDGFEANTDNQNLSVSAIDTDRTVTITGGTGVTFSIADNDNSATNEIELPAIALTNQVLKWNGSGWVAGADQTVDGDASSSNELVTGAALIGGTTLRITEAGVNTDVNLASLQDDADADPTNEIQDLQFTSGNILTITNNASATNIDLSPLKDGFEANTDDQTLSFNGVTNALSISGGNSVTLPSTTKDAFKALLSSSRLVPAGTTTGINFDNVLYDLGGSYSGGGEYKPSVDGIYTFHGVFDVEMASDGTIFEIIITVNGFKRYSMKARTLSLGGDFIGFGFSTDLLLYLGDVVQFVLFSQKDQILNGGEEYYSHIAGRLVVEF